MSPSVQLLEATGTALREALVAKDWTSIGDLDLQCRQAVDEAMVEAGRDEAELRQRMQTLVDLYREWYSFVRLNNSDWLMNCVN